MIPSRIFSFARAALPMAGAPKTEAAPAATPTAPTNPRRVRSSLDMIITFPHESSMVIAWPSFASPIVPAVQTNRQGQSWSILRSPRSAGLLGWRTEAYHVQVVSS